MQGDAVQVSPDTVVTSVWLLLPSSLSATAPSASTTTVRTRSPRPLAVQVAAISVGVVGETPLMDLCYVEDAGAAVDLNVVMTAAGEYVEIQGTGEKRGFTPAELDAMLALARAGCARLHDLQRKALKKKS